MTGRRQKTEMRGGGRPGRFATWCYRACLLGVLAIGGVIRAGLLDVPLERDEGEYAYGGQLLLEGVLPYEGLYSMKMPGIYAAYAAQLSVFGQSHIGVHLGLLVVVGLNTILVFALGRRLVGSAGALAAAGAYTALSLLPTVHGFIANAEHYVLLPALAGLLLLLIGLERRSGRLLFAAGLALGAAALTKQHGAAFWLLAVVYAGIWHCRSGGGRSVADSGRRQAAPIERSRRVAAVRAVGLLTAGPVLLLGIVFLIYLAAGSFEKLWLWTVRYALLYAASGRLSDAPAVLFRESSPVFWSAWLIFAVAAAGLGVQLFGPRPGYWRGDKRERSGRQPKASASRPGRGVPVSQVDASPARPEGAHRGFLPLFALFSFLAICPGFHFRPHYFLLIVPAAALLFGGAVEACARYGHARRLPSGRFGFAIAVGMIPLVAAIVENRDFLFEMSAREISRQLYGGNPFPESLEIADYIRRHSGPQDRLVVLGSEPQIYFYAHRRSVTGHVYMYPMMEYHALAPGMQEEMIRDIERSRPAWIVWVRVPMSWTVRPNSHRKILTWADRYCRRYYRLEGLVDIVAADRTAYYWGQQARTAEPYSIHHSLVYRLSGAETDDER